MQPVELFLTSQIATGPVAASSFATEKLHQFCIHHGPMGWFGRKASATEPAADTTSLQPEPMRRRVRVAAPADSPRDRKSRASSRDLQAKGEPTIVAFPVKVFKDGTTPIGIQLQGTAGEPPTIIEVDPNSPAARCRPQLQVGMRILAIDGQRVLGPQKISRLLRDAVGIVEMEVSQKIEEDAHPNLASGALLPASVGSAFVPLVRVAELRKKTVARKREREREAAPFAVFTRAAGGAGSALTSVAGGVGSAFARVAGRAGSTFATGTPKPAKNVTPRQFKVVLRNPQGAFSLGLVLGGTQEEAPRIMQVRASPRGPVDGLVPGGGR